MKEIQCTECKQNFYVSSLWLADIDGDDETYCHKCKKVTKFMVVKGLNIMDRVFMQAFN